MATYYIDYVGGDDTNNGTTTGTPWQHCPGDANATDTAGAATFSAGDIIYFKKGVSYLGQITCGQSGALRHAGSTGSITAIGVLTDLNATFQTDNVAAGDLVYIYHSKASVTGTWVESCGLFTVGSVESETQLTLSDFDGVAHSTAEMTYVISLPITYTSTAAWGSGPATLSGSGTRNYIFNFVSKNYLRFEALSFYNTSYSNWWDAAIDQGHSGANSTHTYVVDCIFDVIGANTVYSGQYSIMKGCTITNVGYVSFLSPDNNGSSSNGYQLVENNSCDGGTRSWMGGFYQIVRYNTMLNLLGQNGDFGHGDGIGPFGGDGDSSTSYCWIYGNVIDHTYETVAIYGWTTAYPHHLVFHSNLFIGRYGTLGKDDDGFSGRGSSYIYILNNTFLGPSTRGWGQHMVSLANAVLSDHWYIQNNIFAAEGECVQFGDAGSSNITFDYNHYKTTYALPFLWGGIKYDYASWLAQGWDVNSIQNLTTDPLFVSTSFDAPDAHLQSGSPDLARGLNFSSMFTKDRNGNQRAAAGAWDLGAYKYSTSQPYARFY